MDYDNHGKRRGSGIFRSTSAASPVRCSARGLRSPSQEGEDGLALPAPLAGASMGSPGPTGLRSSSRPYENGCVRPPSHAPTAGGIALLIPPQALGLGGREGDPQVASAGQDRPSPEPAPQSPSGP
ncbi:uncharacterized protein LOC124542552 [Vanessa cardui]|uniref:uncharacterized protein LOC124542552 n=1 Tax=Vanessa cardui TaxID=171605 RepID=UPI001F1409B4|nr:uncharacterized protein LOC124542552 [Vanessa cardui]